MSGVRTRGPKTCWLLDCAQSTGLSSQPVCADFCRLRSRARASLVGRRSRIGKCTARRNRCYQGTRGLEPALRVESNNSENTKSKSLPTVSRLSTVFLALRAVSGWRDLRVLGWDGKRCSVFGADAEAVVIQQSVN